MSAENLRKILPNEYPVSTNENQGYDYSNAELWHRLEQLHEIGKSLSAEKDSQRLLEYILIGAKSLTGADGGTLYFLKNDALHFEIMHTDSLNIAKPGDTKETIDLPPIPLFLEGGHPNLKSIASFAALTGKTVNIPDAYTTDEGFDFSGTKLYDEKTGYRSTSFLAIPMKNHENEMIGVLQLINARDKKSGAIRTFSVADQSLLESLASQAAVALSNKHLVSELKRLMERFIEIIASAIDEKSPYTGAHCRRVPEIAMAIANALNSTEKGVYADLEFDSEQLYEIKIAALLHDCGKITTPVHIVDKATKLETIFDRIELIEVRFEIIKRDMEIAYLKQKLSADNGSDPEKLQQLEKIYQGELAQLDSDLEFLKKANIGREFMPEKDIQRLREIANRQWTDLSGKQASLLNENELYNLSIPKGTLTPEEREQINNHIVVTQKMLNQLPFPKVLKNVPEIAGGHHERMDGKGYPNGLTREQMSVQARLMGIADVFEALTASDRPYKKPMPLSQVLTILGNMKLEGHIDPDIFDVFINEGVYLEYARKYLSPEQIDKFELEKIPGYQKL